MDIQCQNHYWQFDTPDEIKSAVSSAITQYRSGDVPLAAQAIFGPVTVNIYQYSDGSFQIGFNNQDGEQRYWIHEISS